MDISPATARALLSYEPLTGVLTWKRRGLEFFDGSARRMNRWNALYAETTALAARHKDGYRHGHLLGRAVLAHRVAWAIQTGNWPIGQIDHIDGKRDNNAFANLRSVTAAGNARNQKRRRSNTTGTMGVRLHTSGRWRVSIGIEGRKVHVGMFDTKDQAVAARRQAELQNGYHSGHGRSGI